MEKIFSQIYPDILLNVVCRKEDLAKNIRFISLESDALQVAAVKWGEGYKIPAHKHIKQIKKTEETQESLVIVQGKVKAKVYDLNDKLIKEIILGEGDCFISFRGGHYFEALEENTLIYEYKTGPYNGKEKDKEFLN